MTRRARDRGRTWVLCLLLSIAPALCADPAGIWGVVLDAEGRPVPRARVLVEDEDSRALFTSAPASDAGEYTLHLIPGRRYRLVGAQSPTGQRFEVSGSAALAYPFLVRERVDVRYQAPPARPSPSSLDADKPWYKRPAGIATLVAVHVAAAAIILGGGGGGGGESPASPFAPGP